MVVGKVNHVFEPCDMHSFLYLPLCVAHSAIKGMLLTHRQSKGVLSSVVNPLHPTPLEGSASAYTVAITS